MIKVSARSANGRYFAGKETMYIVTFALGFSCEKVYAKARMRGWRKRKPER